MSSEWYIEPSSKEGQCNWDRVIIDILINKLEIPNGDAQGVFEVHSFEMTQEWGKGSTPQEAAARIIGGASSLQFK